MAEIDTEANGLVQEITEKLDKSNGFAKTKTKSLYSGKGTF